MVITGLTRNQFASNRTRVRIPSSPPKNAVKPQQKPQGFPCGFCSGLTAFWRKRWDSNPRALAGYLISSQGRYDHFDTLPYMFTIKNEGNNRYSILRKIREYIVPISVCPLLTRFPAEKSERRYYSIFKRNCQTFFCILP